MTLYTAARIVGPDTACNDTRCSRGTSVFSNRRCAGKQTERRSYRSRIVCRYRCGKSTLAKLLQGMYRPSVGVIGLDGTDITHLAANELRSNFGVVPQETILFSGTIYDNLIAAHPHATFEQVDPST